MSGLVQESYAELYKIMKEYPEVSDDTLRVLKHLGEGVPQELLTTMAMINEVAVEGTKLAIKSGDTRIPSLIGDIQMAFSDVGDNRPVIQTLREIPQR